MTARLMIQGAGSNVGKSMLVAGIARAFTRLGLKVRPFKPQNMSNNAAVTEDGGEIGRAQALQARACGLRPHTDMNPVLLKPETEVGAQVVVNGKRLTTVKARDYATLKPTLMTAVTESFARLSEGADLMLVEGAGSPAEVNLRAGDIANMGFAEATETPVILVGDIDRGGVIAQLVGTQAVLPPEDAAHIKGFLINKFRGDVSLFDDGYAVIEERTGWQGLGVAPWFADAHKLPAEDALDIRSGGSGAVRIAVPMISRIANFDDLDPLKQDPNVTLEMIPAGRPLPGDAGLIILPGSKSTRGDLAFLREQGWDIDLEAHRRRGGRILGLCGGYQMLGKTIADPDGIEGAPGTDKGLGLLDIETTMQGDKMTIEVNGRHIATDTLVKGYEIHIGRTTGPDRNRPLLEIAGEPEGAISANGQVEGAYVHGLFASDEFRAAYLQSLGGTGETISYEAEVDQTLDALADHLVAHLDLETMLVIARAA
ncbi:MAG: cobyric acid synthase [Pseudomonadota bacterium]